ncbi:indolepyruvate oxidoreductase subunit beta family protein [Vibrio atypicus]|uniref:indolepyruvate oxidoreductase subunit beta family protein n=1 Tax=Vibrio atypicus TaxID=558271 RepID=UPI00135B74DD|nr:indolepyruvate oxidoreductase subunit beta family protein [Vibrio atypicus]
MNPNNPIKIAILAMGGEGGGVLADWIVNLGERNNYYAQTTSVPGVAQRTGATIYYVELFPKSVAERKQKSPILALMPLPGDVDIVLTSELMEAGRAIQRGLVSKEQTILITSTHRVYSIKEKSSIADGRINSQSIINHAEKAAKHLVHFDMAQVASNNQSVISSVLFGALSETGVLPFSRAQFEDTIKQGGVGVKESLNAFQESCRITALMHQDIKDSDATDAAATSSDSEESHPLSQGFPAQCQPTINQAIYRLMDYQDRSYAEEYIQHLRSLSFSDEPELLEVVARHLALWMSYEDVIRVADLKVRNTRFQRVQKEVGVQQHQLLHIHEFLHPGLDEICELLPYRLGNWIKGSRLISSFIQKLTKNGKIVRTTSLSGFFLMYLLANWKIVRRSTQRHRSETSEISRWLQKIEATSKQNPAIAHEIALCQQLVKGYGETHKQGFQKYSTLMRVADSYPDLVTPYLLKELREAALADDQGSLLSERLSHYEFA